MYKRLSPEEKESIVAAIKSGASVDDVAAAHDIDPATVRAVCRKAGVIPPRATSKAFHGANEGARFYTHWETGREARQAKRDAAAAFHAAWKRERGIAPPTPQLFLVEPPKPKKRHRPRVVGLTRQVAEMLAQGKSTAEIATILGKKPGLVRVLATYARYARPPRTARA